MAQPGKPDIECRISPEMLGRIRSIALVKRQGVTAVARSLWSAGFVMILMRSLPHRGLTNVPENVISELPDIEGVPVGSEKLKFNVLGDDLERLRSHAESSDKKIAQLHRDALAIGLWLDERVERVKKASQSQ